MGSPDPAIGPVWRAWSNVSARPRKRKLSTGPGFGIGILLFLVGAFIGMQLADSPEHTVPPLVTVLGCALGLGAVGFFLGGLIGSGGPSEKLSWYIGERGVQRSEIVSGRVASRVFPFDAHWLLYERWRQIVDRAGTTHDHGILSRLDLVPHAAGQMTVFIPPTISADLREHATEARLRSISQGAAMEFAVFKRPLELSPSWLAERTGTLRLLPDALELTFGGRTERAPLVDLSAQVREGRILFAWAGKRAETEVRTVADVSVFLALLAARGRLDGEET